MRRILVLVATLALSLIAAAPAPAGGWAVTVLDGLPPDIRAGETYAIGYTIKQHGVTPVNVERTEIRITSPDSGKTISFAGVQQGPTGHYVARVTFPYDGRWTWQVTQGSFEPQSLGAIDVKPIGLAATDASAVQAAPVRAAQQPAQPNGPLLTALLLASAGAAILFGTRLASFARRRAAA